ncbi:hypothetical protein NECAME_12629 [Necator americanus]|uniref:Uncharacterized protein n=1 Tax=Necator americanus TaxID=51031 RepID=W2T0Z6_NECAM|nr:hypothetical protein NECAME_12629 [Necator americanus]ETN74906.1 hypothetical protein NECAME_12629 [Necator americanus]
MYIVISATKPRHKDEIAVKVVFTKTALKGQTQDALFFPCGRKLGTGVPATYTTFSLDTNLLHNIRSFIIPDT